LGQSAALCRVSIADQTADREERDLRAFVKKADYKIAGMWIPAPRTIGPKGRKSWPWPTLARSMSSS
jgi:hypothetical protein